MKGLLVTCFRNVEAKCTSEVYQLLDRVYEVTGDEKTDEHDSGLSFEEQIKAEVGQIKDRKEKPFLALDTKGLQCIVFLRCLKDTDPVEATNKMFDLVRDRSIRSVKYEILNLSMLYL
jgi:hypothetical protein